jgi:hypothetical protein
MPRQRRWEPNKCLVHERERRGWSQDDAAQQATKVADRLGQPDLSSRPRSSAVGSGASAALGRRFVA